MCRALILREESESHAIVFTAHHIVCDGWSSGILLRNLQELYEAECIGKSASLPPAYPFQAYAEAQGQTEQIQQAAEAEQYWMAQFATPVVPLELPIDFPRKPSRSYTADRQRREIPDALYRKISRIASEHDCSAYIVLFAAMQVLIHRLSSQSDFVLGAVVAAQAALEEATEMVGHGTNLLPVRATIDPEATFPEYLHIAFERQLDAFDHQSVSFGALLNSLSLPRDPSRNPLVTVSFNFEQVAESFRIHGADAELLPSPKRFATFDLEFHFLRTETSAFIECVHNTGIYRAATIARWLEHYETLLAAICENPDLKLAGLPLLTPGQETALLVSPPESPWRLDECVHQRFERQARLTPDAVAVSCEGLSLTYAGLNRRANALAQKLVSLGAKPDVLVGLCVERGVGMLVGLLGILKAGAAYLPLDVNYPPDRVAFMLQDSGVALLVSEIGLEGKLPKHDATVLFLDDLTEAGDEIVSGGARPENLAYVIYTSGSTGKPKGVEIPHSAVVNMLYSFQQLLEMSADDVLLATTTLSFDIAALELFAPLVAGGTVVIATQAQAEDPLLLTSLLQSSKATIYQATPVRYRLLLEAGWKGSPQLQLLCGGEKMSRELADQLLERCGILWNVYGPTETTVWSSAAKIERDGQPITIGRPIANTTFYILDTHLHPTPVGVHGELFIGGEGVARGYRGRRQLTNERFIENPFGKGRIYKTGDRARWLPDLRVELLGRNDDQVKIRGFRIELGEIEHALQASPGVREAALAVHSEREDDHLVAYIVPEPDIHLTAVEIRESLSRTLPEYMVPSAFVLLERLPLTSNGKLDRKSLPAPKTSIFRETSESVPPQTSTQVRLAALWEALLKVEKLGIHESFFDLGGHSILAARLMAQVRSTFGVQMGLRHIFQTPTVAGLAESIEKNLWVEAAPNASRAASSSSELEIEI